MAKLKLLLGDCFVRLREIEEGSVTAIVGDPPYGLEFMGKDWDSPWKYTISKHGFSDGAERRPAPSFSSSRNPICRNCGARRRTWQGGSPACSCSRPTFDDVEQRVRERQFFEEWCCGWLAECHRCLRSGGIIKTFGGTRMYHRMVRAMRRVGFVDVHLVGWGYGSGFPKSLNISKALDRQAKAERKIVGYKRGVGGENMNDLVRGKDVRQTSEPGARGVGAYGTGAKQVPVDVPITVPATELAALWDGYGTALKPAWEPIVIGRKP